MLEIGHLDDDHSKLICFSAGYGCLEILEIWNMRVPCSEQVKQISVKRITNPLLFDPLNNAVPGGLYDPAMGPTENHQRCACLLYIHVRLE